MKLILTVIENINRNDVSWNKTKVLKKKNWKWWLLTPSAYENEPNETAINVLVSIGKIEKVNIRIINQQTNSF